MFHRMFELYCASWEVKHLNTPHVWFTRFDFHNVIKIQVTDANNQPKCSRIFKI